MRPGGCTEGQIHSSMIFLQIIILVALIKVLIETENALLCAGLFAGVNALLGLLFGSELIPLAIGTAINFGYTFGWFWLLTRFIDGGLVFWVLVIVGLVGPPVLWIMLAAALA